MFSLYFDDSGTHEESPVAVASCYISTYDQWNALEGDWAEAKKEKPFGTFHMADALVGARDFRGWTWEERERLIRRLLTMIRLRARIGLTTSVIKKHYDSLITGKLRERCGKHYSFAVRKCLHDIAAWRSKFGITGPMQYVFDQMSEGKGEIMNILDEYITAGDGANLGLSQGGYSFQSKKNLVPLQAADALAHESLRHMKNCIISPNPQRHDHSDDYMKELAEGYLITGYFDEGTLRTFAENTTRACEELGWNSSPIVSRPAGSSPAGSGRGLE